MWSWNVIKVTESGMNRYSSMKSAIKEKFGIYHTYGVWEIQVLKFSTSSDTWPNKTC